MAKEKRISKLIELKRAVTGILFEISVTLLALFFISIACFLILRLVSG